MHRWLHTRSRPRRIPRLVQPMTALLAMVAAALPLSGARAYRVEPGSTENIVVLQLDDRSGSLTGLSLDVEAAPSTDWIEVLSTSVHEGRVREIEVRFSVHHIDVGSLGYLEVVARSSSAGLILSRTVPLEVALVAPVIQRSFSIDECCLQAAGIDPADLSRATPALLGNTPNPVLSLTDIVFDLGAAGGTASLIVHDIHGRLLRSIETPALSRGIHRISWDGRDEGGRDLPSGVYFYTVASGDWSETRKLQLLR